MEEKLSKQNSSGHESDHKNTDQPKTVLNEIAEDPIEHKSPETPHRTYSDVDSVENEVYQNIINKDDQTASGHQLDDLKIPSINMQKRLSSQDMLSSIRLIDSEYEDAIYQPVNRNLENPEPCIITQIKNSNVNNGLLSKQDSAKKDTRAHHNYCCECAICSNNIQNLPNTDDFSHFNECDTTIDNIARCDYMQNFGNDDDRDFSFIIKRLQPVKMSTGVSKTIKLCVPDTIMFLQGEIKLVLQMTGKQSEKQQKFIKQKDKTTFSDIRKSFPERRKKEKQMLECGGIKLRTITSEVYESQATMGGRSPEKANLKKSNTRLGKSGIFNGSILSKQANFQNQDDNQVETANIEMAYICRYNQENYSQMLTEQEFFNLFMKSKTAKLWSELMQIQTIPQNSKTKYGQLVTFKIKFKEENAKNTHFSHHLFHRAEVETKIILERIPGASMEFISEKKEEEFQRLLKNRYFKEYCRYLTYKIFHFIKHVHRVKLSHFSTEWAVGQRNEPWLVNAKIYRQDDLSVDPFENLNQFKNDEGSTANEQLNLINIDQENQAIARIFALYKEHLNTIKFSCEKNDFTIPDFLDEHKHEIDNLIKMNYPYPKKLWIKIIRNNEVTGPEKVLKILNELMGKKYPQLKKQLIEESTNTNNHKILNTGQKLGRKCIVNGFPHAKQIRVLNNSRHLYAQEIDSTKYNFMTRHMNNPTLIKNQGENMSYKSDLKNWRTFCDETNFLEGQRVGSMALQKNFSTNQLRPISNVFSSQQELNKVNPGSLGFKLRNLGMDSLSMESDMVTRNVFNKTAVKNSSQTSEKFYSGNMSSSKYFADNAEANYNPFQKKTSKFQSTAITKGHETNKQIDASNDSFFFGKRIGLQSTVNKNNSQSQNFNIKNQSKDAYSFEKEIKNDKRVQSSVMTRGELLNVFVKPVSYVKTSLKNKLQPVDSMIFENGESEEPSKRAKTPKLKTRTAIF